MTARLPSSPRHFLDLSEVSSKDLHHIIEHVADADRAQYYQGRVT